MNEAKKKLYKANKEFMKNIITRWCLCIFEKFKNAMIYKSSEYIRYTKNKIFQIEYLL